MAKILFTRPAEYDLINIEYYIFVDLNNPQAADRIVDGLISTIQKLESYPMMHPVIKEPILSRRELRMVRFDNYNIFYYYDVSCDIVHIIRILYNKTDWENTV